MSWDVIVVGAGSAGSAVALQTAQRGLSTLVLEKHALASAGAHWVNGVFAGAFAEAGVPLPVAPELRAAARRFHLVAGWGPAKRVIEDTGIIDVDMRLLLARLRDGARAAGAELRERCGVSRIAPGVVESDAGPLHARVIVDASGLGGTFAADKPHRNEVCAAAQGIYGIVDAEQAVAFFRGFGAAAGETVCFGSVAGGYSIVAVRLEEPADGEGGELSILTGSLPALGHPAGKALRDTFAARHPWIGPLRFGGHAPIPLHRPRRRLAFVDGERAIVRIGDAAGQVFAAHGSGIGAQLVAARMLAERLAGAGPRGARAWERDWHRRFGPVFLAADVFRRASTLFGPRAARLLMRLPPSLLRLGFAAGL